MSDTVRRVYDKAAYSSARHQGLRQAYATLLGLDKYTPWEKSVAELRGGHRAEVNRLQHRGRSVELVFLNTAMHTPLGGRMGLPSLWEDQHLQLPVVIAEGSPLTRAKSYTYDDMVDVLAGILDDYSPTLVQTLDPDPDIQHSSPAVRSHDSEQPGYADHADHTAAASFAWAAMIRHAEQGNAFLATAYRAYYNRHWPKNLPPKVLAEKAAHLVPYGGRQGVAVRESGRVRGLQRRGEPAAHQLEGLGALHPLPPPRHPAHPVRRRRVRLRGARAARREMDPRLR